MYDFKHQIHNTQRFNTYELYIHRQKRPSNSYKKLRNGLFFILFILTVFITGAFSFKKYQEYNTPRVIYNKQILIKSKREEPKDEIKHVSHLEFTTAITNSVIRNLQAKQVHNPIDNNEIKRIIKKVINKIQEETNPTKYTQK